MVQGSRFRRPSPAMVVALIALFVALAGSSYAYVRVGSAEIANNSIRSADIHKAAVKSTDLKNSGVLSKDVRNGSLLFKDIKEGQLPATELTVRRGEVARGPIANATVQCEPRERAVGGGGIAGEAASYLLYSVPSPLGAGGTPTGWIVGSRHLDGEQTTAQAYVVCSKR